MNTIGKLFFPLAGYLAIISTIPAGPFARPLCSDGETAVYKSEVTGRKTRLSGWGAEATARYQPIEWTQKIEHKTEEIVWRRLEKLAGGGKREMVAVIKSAPQTRVVSWMDTFLSPAGKQESMLEVDFTDPSLKYPIDMFPIFVLPLLLRGANLNNTGVEHESHVWWGPMTFSRGIWKVTGKKKVTVPAGTFQCYEIEARILIDDEGIIADTLEKFLPKYYYYLNVEHPQQMVQFKAPIPGRETLIDSLVKFTPGI